MAAVLVHEELLKKDLYNLETIEDVLDSIHDIGKSINKASLFYAWMLGKFANSERLKTKFNLSVEELAEQLGISMQTLYRYRKVKQMLTEAQITVLAERGVSINAVLEISTISRRHQAEADHLLEALLDGNLNGTVKDVNDALVALINQRQLPYNMLPGGEPPPPEDEDDETLEDTENAIGDDIDPAEKLVGSDDEDECEDEDFADMGDPSLNKRDAKAMLRTVRSSLTVIRRDFANIINNLQEQLERVEQAQSVIIGDQESSDEYDMLLSDMYTDLVKLVPIVLQQSCKGVDAGLITQPIPVTYRVGELFDGQGLLLETK
jgi:transcriptional regulator with XRE-family HTH domain